MTFAERAYAHRDELLGYLCRRGMARNRQDAEDLVHDILARAIDEEHKGKYEERGTLRAWLFEMLRHEAFRYRTRLKRISHATVEHLETPHLEGRRGQGYNTQSNRVRGFSMTRFDPERPRQDDSDDLSTTVLSAMKQLSADQYEVVYRRFAGQSYEQIAKACSISIGTVGSRIDRASRKLRPLLGEYALARYGIGS